MPDGTLLGRPSARLLRHDHALQARLARWNRTRFALRAPPLDWQGSLASEIEMRAAETAFIENCRAEQHACASAAPHTPDAFVRWFEALRNSGPGQNDALFPWLAESATREEMRWFVAQEAAGEAGFDDLVAMAQVKAPTQAKLELARNYWDEMGRGNAKGMHGPMLEALVRELNAQPSIATTLAPSLALGNTMAALAANRAYGYLALGALGVIELTAPTRAAHVSAGLKRLNASSDARHYFDLHAVLDVRHSEAWNREIFAPIVAETPEAAPLIAEGALMRLVCGAACFDAYRAHLWGGDGSAPP
jgi:hypothetical protein